ncbi:MAG: helix-turn-helix domain-containing protein [Sphingomonadales bacterium]|jgi:predicted site-specific integrase-resolvase
MTSASPLGPAEPILLPEEAAAELRISERTLRRLKQRRLIRFVRISDRKWGLRPSDIAAYLAGRVEQEADMTQAKTRSRMKRGQMAGNIVYFSQRPRQPKP